MVRRKELLGATALLQRALLIEGLHADLTRLANDSGEDAFLSGDAPGPQRWTTRQRRFGWRSGNKWRSRRWGWTRRLEASASRKRPLAGISATARRDADSVLTDALALAVGVFRAASSKDDKRHGGEAQHGRSFRVRERRCSRSLKPSLRQPNNQVGWRWGCWTSTRRPMKRASQKARISGRWWSTQFHRVGTGGRWSLGGIRRRLEYRLGCGTARHPAQSRSTSRSGVCSVHHPSCPASRRCPACRAHPGRPACPAHPSRQQAQRVQQALEGRRAQRRSSPRQPRPR